MIGGPPFASFIQTCPLVRLCQLGRGARHRKWASVMQTTLIKALSLLHRTTELGGEWVSLNFEHKIVACRPRTFICLAESMGARAVSYSIKLGKEPNVFTVNDLSRKQAVDQARELKAGNIKFGIYASDGTLTELYDLERDVEGDDVANRN